MRKTLLQLIPVVLLGLVIYMLFGPGSGTDEPVSPAGSREGESESERTLQTSEQGDASRTVSEPQRAQLQSTPPPISEAFRVRVLDKATREPIPGAEVSYFGNDVFDQLSDEDRDMHASRGWDGEWVGKRWGTTVRADRGGLVYIPVQEGVTVVGRSERLYGEAYLRLLANRSPDEEHELLLERDLSVRVVVIDSRGDPAFDVPIGVFPIYPKDYGSGSYPVLVVARTSRPDGVAEISHLQLKTFGNPELPHPIGYVLRPWIPGLSEGGITVDPDVPVEDPAVIQLPPTGRIVVSAADPNGRRLPRLPFMMISLSLANDERQHWSELPGNTETVTFERAVAGKDYRISAGNSFGGIQRDFRGPGHQDHEVQFELRLEEEYYGLEGRILGEDGRPLADSPVTASFETELADRRKRFTTDHGGFFWLYLGPAGEDNTLTKLSLTQEIEEASGPPPTFVFSGATPLIAGDNDLGDLVLSRARPTLLAAGRVLVDGRAPGPIQGRFSVSAWHPTGTGTTGRWSLDRPVDLAIAEDGHFEVLGTVESTRYRMRFQERYIAKGFLPLEDIEFAPGDRDLQINLEAGGSLEAVVLVDQNLPLDDLWLRLEPSGGQVPDVSLKRAPDLANRLYARAHKAEPGRETFRWDGLWPGTYVLEILPRGGRTKSATIPDIQIAKGHNSDPRLQDIDLRGAFREIAVTVTDPSGDPIAKPLVLIRDGTSSRWPGYSPGDGVAKVLTADPYVDLLVKAYGYKPQEFPAVDSDIQVRLDRLEDVRVKVIAPELPDGVRFMIAIRRDELQLASRRYTSDFGAGILGAPSPPTEFEGHEATVQADGLGIHEVQLSLMDVRTGESYLIENIQPTELEVRDSDEPHALVVRVTEEGFKEALDKLEGR